MLGVLIKHLMKTQKHSNIIVGKKKEHPDLQHLGAVFC